MATQRLPRQKYLRELRAMRNDFEAWAERYWSAAQDTHPEWLQGRFLDRYAITNDLVDQLERVIDSIDRMPRLA